MEDQCILYQSLIDAKKVLATAMYHSETAFAREKIYHAHKLLDDEASAIARAMCEEEVSA